MTQLKKTAKALLPIVDSIWYNIALVVVLLAQILIRNQALVVLTIVMIFVYFGVQMLATKITKRQCIFYSIILGLNALTVVVLLWATFW